MQVNKSQASLGEALETAQLLRSEQGENPEYDRALCELIVDLFEIGSMEEGRDWVAVKIGVPFPVR